MSPARASHSAQRSSRIVVVAVGRRVRLDHRAARARWRSPAASGCALADYKAADPTGVPAALAKASLVERGDYLARAADCMACHTAQGGKAYRRRPRVQAAVRHALLDQHHARQGNRHRQLQRRRISSTRCIAASRRDGARLYPAMPYTSYTYMTDADALAIKAYLFSLPPVRAAAPAEYADLPVQPALG